MHAAALILETFCPSSPGFGPWRQLLGPEGTAKPPCTKPSECRAQDLPGAQLRDCRKKASEPHRTIPEQPPNTVTYTDVYIYIHMQRDIDRKIDG